MSSSSAVCACGLVHPAGFVCDLAGAEAACPSGTTEPHARAGQQSPCSCSQEHESPQAVDQAILDQASDTRALYRIMNMDCPMEEALIRAKLGSMPGITGLSFNLVQRVLSVDHELPSTAPIEEALRSINMIPQSLAGAGALPESRIPWKRLLVAGIFAALAEISELIGQWGARPFGLDPATWNIGGQAVLDWLPLIFAAAAILFAGFDTYKKGWISIRTLNLNINALMSVAVTGAVCIGQYPEAAMVMVLFNLAEAIEAKSFDRARKAIRKLMDLAPERATMLMPDGSWAEKDIRQIAVGSRVRVRPGERVALDGLIALGRSAINQAPITGESLPVEKGEGDTVFAGSINESGSFEFVVSAGASNSTLARIIHAVEEAQSSRAPVQRLVDRFARVYTPAVFLTSILVAIVPPLFLDGAWTHWIYTALVLLVIGCPCALVISTPVSIVSGMAAATRHGILVKGGMFLEQGRLLKLLALDKTGTITQGKAKQSDFLLWKDGSARPGPEKLTARAAEDEAHASDERDAAYTLRSLAASLAARSDHPVSRAIGQAAREQQVRFLEVDDFTAVPGQGVSGLINQSLWLLGNHRMVEERGHYSDELEAAIAALEQQGKSVVALMSDAGVAALFAVADSIKPGSAEAVRQLRALGIRTVMLTGDNTHTARVIAEQAGVDEFKAELLPGDKLAEVEALARKLGGSGKVGMVGDGINDAPALAKADIGFAMAAAGSDAAIETADVALMDDDLGKIPRFVRLSRATHAILMQNIVLALGVKALFFALTFMGLATMWMAVFADVGTSLLVVANGLRAMGK
ncbi:heavy metal translocating P-type ATPase [Desulfovibrio sp. OttesenSCG-928-A18]|nr:heavy metal translocating P-type ATPase [Desulfovibrio sp. OttesenSCG-928-A18]